MLNQWYLQLIGCHIFLYYKLKMLNAFICFILTLKERLACVEHQINKLGGFCRFHDIAYEKSNFSTDKLRRADEVLENHDWEVKILK